MDLNDQNWDDANIPGLDAELSVFEEISHSDTDNETGRQIGGQGDAQGYGAGDPHDPDIGRSGGRCSHFWGGHPFADHPSRPGRLHG